MFGFFVPFLTHSPFSETGPGLGEQAGHRGWSKELLNLGVLQVSAKPLLTQKTNTSLKVHCAVTLYPG